MCIVALAWQVLPNLPLCLISNRDEFYHRPTKPLHHWPSGIIAGQDERAYGTWLGVTAHGRWAVLANHRDGRDQRDYATSRGNLVVQYLQSTCSPMTYARQLESEMMQYAGFNLIIGTPTQAVHISNRGDGIKPLAHGVYVMSNGLMSEHWQKCAHLRKRYTQELLPIAQQQLLNHQDLSALSASLAPIAWQLLEDKHQLDFDQLPETGISAEWEKQLSSTFIHTEHYGTRVSNFLLLSDTQLQWQEKQQSGQLQGAIEQISLELHSSAATDADRSSVNR